MDACSIVPQLNKESNVACCKCWFFCSLGLAWMWQVEMSRFPTGHDNEGWIKFPQICREDAHCSYRISNHLTMVAIFVTTIYFINVYICLFIHPWSPSKFLMNIIIKCKGRFCYCTMFKLDKVKKLKSI